ncbi:MAG: DNA alkylation repair protein [Cyclobacteriaceae bacterium]|nr:DNA alkylation repair protein [Cyclobacteriaceae bacterium]
MDQTQINQLLVSYADASYKQSLSRFGIPTDNVLGVRKPHLKSLAKSIGKNHDLAVELWNLPVHENKLLACLLAEPKHLSRETTWQWAISLYSWDLCDSACMLFAKLPFARSIAIEWIDDQREFVRRAGLVTLTLLVVHDKKMSNDDILPFLNFVKQHATDERNFVMKAVNWLLRQIGKRNLALHTHALALAHELATSSAKPARWIGQNARRELALPKQIERLKAKDKSI